MLTELHRKGGCLCQPARDGKLRCPLIVRPSSEDVITGHLVHAWRVIDPRWWLPDLLNEALDVHAFRPQVFRGLRIEPWVNMPAYPRELLPWDEGSTQVDVTITWENPPTTVYLEMKYGSDLSATTSRNHGQYGFPADQLSRNARVGLLDCGYFRVRRLFGGSRRDFLLLVVSPERGQPLVTSYRDPVRLRAAIPHSDLIPRLPRLPFVGELGYIDIARTLRRHRRWFTPPERVLADQVAEYLEFKLATRPRRSQLNVLSSLFDPGQAPPAGSEAVDPTLEQGDCRAEAAPRPASS